MKYIGSREMREFADVDFSKSFVLSWGFESASLLIDVDVLLEEGHPSYEVPRPAEKVCIRAAILEFPFCESIQADGKTSSASLPELAMSLSTGAIKDLRRLNDGPFELRGEFGTVRIDAERPLLRFRAS